MAGTTFSYFPSEAFAAFKAELAAQVNGLRHVDGPDPRYTDVCYKVRMLYMCAIRCPDQRLAAF